MAHAGFVAYVVCCIGSDVSSNLRELHHELLSMMPMLRQAVDQQQQQQQSPFSHHEDINIAEPAENIAGMDRDDVLHWLMHCAGGGLDRFSVHAYEQNLDGRALMTWTDARFAAAGIGAADFSYTGEEGSAAREAAAHSRSTDSVYGLRAAIAVLRGSPAEGRFSLFRYDGPRLVAIESINRPADHMMGRRLIAAGVSPTPEQAADPAFDLRSLA